MNLSTRVGGFFSRRSVSQKTLERLCLCLLVVMLLPLFVVALYNYPADDDFASALPAATAWLQTHSLAAVGQALYDYAVQTYNGWQGNYISGLFCTVSPMIFSQNLYFLSNWLVLTLLCLSVGYLLKTVLIGRIGASKRVFWIVYTAMLVLALQFMPVMGEGVYWHTGGMYLVAFCVAVQMIGLLLRCREPMTRARRAWRLFALALCGVMEGGSFYGPAFGTLIFVLLMTGAAFAKRSRSRWYCVWTLAFFAASFAFSAASPGIAIRQSALGEPMNPLRAVLATVTDSFDTFGGWLSPQLLAMLMLALPVLWKPLKQSKLTFSHPFWFFVMMYGLFSATMAPGEYTMGSYAVGRYTNVIYLDFLLLIFASAAYAEGWLIRFLEKRAAEDAARGGLADVSDGAATAATVSTSGLVDDAAATAAPSVGTSDGAATAATASMRSDLADRAATTAAPSVGTSDGAATAATASMRSGLSDKTAASTVLTEVGTSDDAVTTATVLASDGLSDNAATAATVSTSGLADDAAATAAPSVGTSDGAATAATASASVGLADRATAIVSSSVGTAARVLAATERLGERFTVLYLTLCLALLTFGGFAFTIMNTSSVCATKALITGEAAQFRAEMAARQEYIRVTPSDDAKVDALTSQPYIFKADKLPIQGIYGRIRYMKWYFELFDGAGE